jgi:hypothetical protein
LLCEIVLARLNHSLLHQFGYPITEFICELCWKFRPLCLLEHLALHNETGLDPPGIRLRAVPGLVAADYFAPGYFVWAVLIENLAKIGYEGKNMHMAAYDWRLSFQNTEVSRFFPAFSYSLNWED